MLDSMTIIWPSPVHGTSRVVECVVVLFRMTPTPVSALSLSFSMCLTRRSARDTIVTSGFAAGLLTDVAVGVTCNLFRIFCKLTRFVGVFDRTCRWKLNIDDQSGQWDASMRHPSN